MRLKLTDIALVTLTLCALTTTALVAKREFTSPSAPLRTPQGTPAADWRTYSTAGHRMGPAAAPVTIVVFSDFQCRFCGILMAELHKVRAAHPRDVAVVYRHFPLGSHPHAVNAARASDCAAEQGRFGEYHDALFAAQDSIGARSWTRFAEVSGVPDLPRFTACASSTAPVGTVARDTVAGRRLQVTGTPTLLINDLRFTGALPGDSLDAYVRRALRSAAASPS